MANLISILPTDGSVLYEGAIVPIEVTLTLDEGQDLPPGCAVTASVPSGSYGQLEIGSEFGITSTLPVVKINATTARAVFYLALSSGEVGAAVTLNISVWPADFATAVSPKYEIGVKPRITYHDPRPVYLTTAPDAAQTPETFLSIRYAAKVEDNDNAVPGYVMEWRQVWDSALFTNMRPFGAANGAPLPVLPEAIAPKAFVRTLTDESGLATLYLVPTNQQVFGAVHAFGDVRSAWAMESVVVMNPDAAAEMQQPVIQLTQVAGGYDLDSTPGNFVGVTISSASLPKEVSLRILLFANGELVRTLMTRYSDEKPPPPTLAFDVAKSAFYSNTGANAGQFNHVFYVVAGQPNGVNISRPAVFQATGSRGSNHPSSPPGRRVLMPPYVEPDGTYVNVATIADGLNLCIPTKNVGMAWTPAGGDRLTATIYLNGWTPDGKPATNSFQMSYVLAPIDLEDDVYVFNFDHPLIAGYDPSPDIPSQEANFTADYFVLPGGEADISTNYIYSDIFSRALDTAAPGSVAWAPARDALHIRHRPGTDAVAANSSTSARAKQGPVLGLAPPNLPQASPQDGTIDLDNVGATIQIAIPAYTDLRPYDEITAYIGEDPAEAVVISQTPLPSIITVNYPVIGLLPGRYPVWYTAVDYGSKNPSTSPSTRVLLTSSTISGDGGWSEVGPISFNFDGLGQHDARAVRIYANGRHQAALKISITLLNASGQLLNPPDYPPISDVIKAIQLIDFDTRTPLGSGLMAQWAVDSTANAFNKHLPPANGRDDDLKATARDDSGNRIEHSVAYLTLYVRSQPTIMSYRVGLGMKIVPNGGEADSKPFFNSQGGNVSQPAYLQALENVIYSTSELSVSGVHDLHDGESDDALYNHYGPEIQGNYWRKWDYTVRLAARADGNRIFQCRVKSALPADCSFSSASNGVYAYKAYFWPRNVFDASGKPVQGADQPDFPLQAPGSSIEYASPPTDDDLLALTLFCTFGTIDAGAYSYTPVDLQIYDQFGNCGDFTLDPLRLPQGYDVTTLPTLSFLVNGAGQAGSARSQPGSNGPVNVSCTGWHNLIVPLGLNTDSGVASTLEGRQPLQLTLRNETFLFTDTSNQPYSSNRVYRISVAGADSGMTIDYDHHSEHTLVAPIGATDSAAPWYLGPIWARNTVALSTPGDGDSWYSWYPETATTGRSVSWIGVFIGQYAADKQFEWKIG